MDVENKGEEKGLKERWLERKEGQARRVLLYTLSAHTLQ